MKNRNRFWILFSIILLSSLWKPWAQEWKKEDTLFVKSYQTHLFKSPSIENLSAHTLQRGNSVTFLEKQDVWIKVKAGEKTGWLMEFHLSSKPIQKRVLLSQTVDLTSAARKRASTFTSTAAARGLADSGQQVVDGQASLEMTALSRIESQAVREEEALEFLSKGE